ncbi:MAG: DUF1616 domain-containing protein [Acidimicrobiales bacterium]
MTVYRRQVTVLLIAAALLTGGSFVPVPAVRAVMVLVPALLLPGTALLFGLRALRGRWDLAPTLALGVITSLAFYPLGALLIYVVRLRLTTLSVVVEVDAFLVLMLAIGLMGRKREQPERPLLEAQTADGIGGRRWGVWVIAVTATCAGVLILGLLVLPKATPVPYTEFYFTGATAKLGGTVTVAPGAKVVIPITVKNRAGAKTLYHVRAELDGSAFALDPVSVPKSGTWSGSIEGTIDQPGCLHHLVIDLINQTGDSTAASLDLWIQEMKVGCSGVAATTSGPSITAP